MAQSNRFRYENALAGVIPDPGAPPGPRGPFLIGHINEFRADPLKLLSHSATYGDLSSWFFGPFRVYQANAPDVIRDVLVEESSVYYKDRLTRRVLGLLLGNGLLISDGEFWKRQRRLIQPAFHSKRISAYADVMVRFAARMADSWGDGKTQDIHQAMMRLTLEVVAKTLFDADVSAQVDEIGWAVKIGQENSNRRFSSIITEPEWLPTPRQRRGKKAVATLNRIILGFIHDRQASGDDTGDLLSMLVMAKDEDGTGMPTEQIRAEAMTLFLAGHDTTANTLTWTWALLDQNPKVREKLQAELAEVLGGRAPTFEDLPRLVYTEQVIRESMRMYPPAWLVAREPIQEVALGGYRIPKQATVFISPYSVHHDPRWWADPEKFDPERFATGWEDRIPKYAYIPFGGGPRICIGNSFAHMEARLILATIAQRWQMTLPPGAEVKPAPLVTLHPKGGLPMRLSARVTAVAG